MELGEAVVPGSGPLLLFERNGIAISVPQWSLPFRVAGQGADGMVMAGYGIAMYPCGDRAIAATSSKF